MLLTSRGRIDNPNKDRSKVIQSGEDHHHFTSCHRRECSWSNHFQSCSRWIHCHWNSSKNRSSWSLPCSKEFWTLATGTSKQKTKPSMQTYSGSYFQSSSWYHLGCCRCFLGCWFREAWLVKVFKANGLVRIRIYVEN